MAGLAKKLGVLAFFVLVLAACEYTVEDPGGQISVGESVYLVGYGNIGEPAAIEMTQIEANTYLYVTAANTPGWYYSGYLSDGNVSWMPDYRTTWDSGNSKYGIILTEDPALWGKPTLPAIGSQIKGIEYMEDDTFSLTLSIFGDHNLPVDGRTHVMVWSNGDTTMFEPDMEQGEGTSEFNNGADTVTVNGDAVFTMKTNEDASMNHFNVYSGLKLLNSFQFSKPQPVFAIDSSYTEPATSVTASVYTLNGSNGLLDNTLKYAWTQTNAIPDESVFQSFSSNDVLTKTNSSGNWYLHVEAEHVDGYAARKVFGPYEMIALPPIDSDDDDNTDEPENPSSDQQSEEAPTVPTTVKKDVGGSAPSTAELIGKAKVNIPAGVLPALSTLTIAVVPSDSAPSFEGRDALSEIISLTLDDGQHSFSEPLSLEFLYDKNMLAAGQQPSVYYFNEKQQRWIYIGGTVNADGTISVSIDHFTKFAVFAEKPIPVFSDLNKHWAEPYTARLIGMDVISGFEDRTFKPDDTVTREQFARMIVSALGLKAREAKANFADETSIGVWAKSSVTAAVEAGLISGYDEKGVSVFKAGQSITRAEIAAVLSKVLGSSVAPKEQELAFKDSATIPEWAREAVAQAVRHGIVKGFEDGTFRPAALATRAEAARMLDALLDALDI